MNKKQRIIGLYQSADEVELAFYEAFGSGDFTLMESLYADKNVSYTHAGNPTIIGREDVINNWKFILDGLPKKHIDRKVLNKTIFDNVEIHQVLESFELDRFTRKVSEVYSTNVFVLQDNGWRLQTQHASLSKVKKIAPEYRYAEIIDINIEDQRVLN